MKRLLLAALLLLPVQLLQAEELTGPVFDYENPSNQELLQTPCSLKEYPDADTVLLFLHEGSQYETNGTYVSYTDECVKILTEPGKRESLVASTYYNVAYGTSYFHRVTIIKPDGREVEIATTNSSTMIDSSQMSANIYDPASKVVQISLAGLEVGDIYRVRTVDIGRKARMKDTWSGGFLAELMCPVVRMTFDVYAPEAKPLAYVTKRFEIPGTVTESQETKDGRIHYRWEVKDVPQIFPEPAMASFTVACQRYYYATVKSWEDVSRWYAALCAPRLACTTPEMEQKAQELVKDCKTVREKAVAIHRWVAKEVRYSGLTTEEVAPGYEPHDVKITFENRYGVCRDKAALLCAMHRLVGLEAYPVLISVGPKKEQEAPNCWFNHAINCVVDENGEYILMDSTPEHDKNLIPAYESDCSYLIAREEGETLRTTPNEAIENNLALETVKGRFDKEGNLSGEISIVLHGVNDTGLRGHFLTANDETKKKVVENLLSRVFTSSEVFDYEIAPRDLHDMGKPLTISVKFKAQGVLSEDSGLFVMRPIYSLAGVCTYAPATISSLDTSLDKRRFPMRVTSACGTKTYCELDMGALECELVSKPEFPAFDLKAFGSSQSVAMTNGILYCTSVQEMRAKEVPAEDYRSLQEFRQAGQKSVYQRLFFKARQGSEYKDAHVVVLDNDSTIEILDAGTTRSHGSVTKKILDYAGKKSNSELHLHYCEASTQASFTNIYVVMEDGSVRKTVPSEINLMDASWKASAPRYPDVKQIVVTLPGTEIGSTVHYETDILAKDQPLVAGAFGFDPGEPVLHYRRAIIVPAGLPFRYHKTVPSAPDPVVTMLPGNRVQYVWERYDMTNIVKKEIAALPGYMTDQDVYYTCGTWEGYAAQLKSEIERAAAQNAAVKDKVLEITAGCTTLKQKLVAVRNFVELNVRAGGPGFLSLPLSAISGADATLNDGYGHSMDQAVLYVAMLRELGLAPEVHMAGYLDQLNLTQNPSYFMPMAGTFSAPYVSVVVDGRRLFVNDGSQYDLLETSGPDYYTLLDLASGQLSTFERDEQYRSRHVTSYDVTVNGDGTADIARTVTYQGGYYGALVREEKETLPEMRRRENLQAAEALGKGAQILEDFARWTNAYPARTTIKVRVPNYVQQDGDLLYLRPFCPLGFYSCSAPARATRYYASSRDRNECVFKVTFPEGYTEAVFMPDMFYTLPAGAGTYGCKVEHEPGTTVWTLRYTEENRPAVLDQEQYHQLHLIGRKLAGQGFTTVAVRKAAAQETKE